MSEPDPRLRLATVADGPAVLSLWAQLSDGSDLAISVSWEAHARDWFNRMVEDTTTAWFPLVEVGDQIVRILDADRYPHHVRACARRDFMFVR